MAICTVNDCDSVIVHFAEIGDRLKTFS